jgi:DNA-binding transcriptional regulator YiaG
MLCVNPKHLRWATPKENMADQYKHGTRVMGEKHPQSKLSEFDVREIRKAADSESQDEIAARFGVSRATVSDIINRRTWDWLE